MKRFTTTKAYPIVLLISLTLLSNAPTNAEVKISAAKKTQQVSNQVLVRFKQGISVATKNAAHGKDKPTSEHGFKHFDGLKLFKLPPGLDVQTAIEHYKKNPNVLYAEADNIVGLSSTNDTSFNQLWGLNNTGQTVNGTSGTADADMNIVEAWANAGVTGSNSVVIGVIDSGVQYNHPDLANNMWINPGEIPGNGIDDDSNGYIDDVYGINAITNSGNPMDDNNHGTHVAGTIAAVGDNSQGITGVNQQAKILACKFLNAAGSGSSSDSLKCLDYIYDLKMKGVNIVVTNNSWGGTGGGSQAIADAIEKHRQAGILFVAAAGNSGTNNDTGPHYPSNYFKANVISVAATDQNDAKASFSNYGKRSVHVGAPGVNIYSSIVGSTYSHLQGTSMAAPHVAGLAALLSAEDPGRDWKTIKNLILSSGTQLAALSANTTSGRRIRAWDSDGTGAMTCNNQTVNSVLYPQTTNSTKIAGTKLGLAVLNINCATAAGTVSVSTSGPQAVGAITLQDNGLDFDEVAGDGIYSTYWTAPATTGSYTLTFSNGQTQTVSVIANTSTRQSYRAPVEITYNPRSSTSTFSQIPDNSYIYINGYTAYYQLPIGGVNTTNIYAIPQGGNVLNAPTSAQLTGVNTPIPNDIFETLLAGYWDDLDVYTAGYGVRAWWSYNSAATPVGEAVFEWKARHKTSGNLVQFQIVYTANSPDIEVHYISTDNNGESATIGMQVDWVRAAEQSFNIVNPDIAAGKAWKWSLDTGAPTANAGTDQNVIGNSLVTLVGSASDPDGGTLNYNWTQTAGTLVTINNANTLSPTFYAANVDDTLTFKLTVSDDSGQMAIDTVNINITAGEPAGSLQFDASTYSVNEDGTSASITITRINGSGGIVGITYATGNNVAVSPGDYTHTTGSLSWADGDTSSKTFIIPIVDDTTIEANETISLYLLTPTGGASLGSSTATLTIIDNDYTPAGSIGFSPSTYNVNENAGSLLIGVTRTGSSIGAVSVNYASADDSAIAGSDYTSSNGTLTWADGDSSAKTITLNISDDVIYEGDEILNLNLSSATNGATIVTPTATVNIIENEVFLPGVLSLDTASINITEDGLTATVSVTRTNGTDGAVSVVYDTIDDSAIDGEDYAAVTGILEWAHGDSTSKTITVDIIDDTITESDEIFTIALSDALNATINISSTSVTINDNDVAPIAANQAPDTPTLIAPADGSTGVSPGLVSFEWNSVTDPDGDVVSYILEYCDNVDFTNCNATQTAQLKMNSPTLLAGLGGSAGLSLMMFGLVGTSTRRQRLIHAVTLITVAIIMSACGTNIPLPGENGTMSQLVTNLQPNTTYYWKVTATDNNGLSSVSDVWSFTTL